MSSLDYYSFIIIESEKPLIIILGRGKQYLPIKYLLPWTNGCMCVCVFNMYLCTVFFLVQESHSLPDCTVIFSINHESWITRLLKRLALTSTDCRLEAPKLGATRAGPEIPARRWAEGGGVSRWRGPG